MNGANTFLSFILGVATALIFFFAWKRVTGELALQRVAQ